MFTLATVVHFLANKFASLSCWRLALLSIAFGALQPSSAGTVARIIYVVLPDNFTISTCGRRRNRELLQRSNFLC